MKKVLITATLQSHICQFHRPLADMLHKNGYGVHVAAKNNLAEKNGLVLDFADEVFDIAISRSPKSPSNVKAYKQLKQIIDENQYDVIHCNTPVGGVVTRLAAKRARKNGSKVIYTAHGFHFYNGAPKKNWLIYYPFEKMMEKHTDALVTINKDDLELAKKRFKKIPHVYLMHGVGIDFDRIKCDLEKESVRAELGLANDDFVLLSVGELNKNKNNIAILRAIAKLNDKKIKYLIAGNGPLREYLESEIEALGLADQVKFLGYTRNIGQYHKAADAFCFVSHREGLGLAAIEAMYSGLPLVTSDIRGINDYSVDGVTGFKSAPNDVDGFAENIKQLMESPETRAQMGENNKTAALIYSDVEAEKALEKIYTEIEK